MTTQEIAKAISHLEIDTLKAALGAVGRQGSGNKDEALKGYQDAVLDVGLENFIKKLKDSDLATSCKLVDVDVSKDTDGNRKALQAAVGKLGITKFIDKADEHLLKNYCSTLSLETDGLTADDLRKQIADEVMLTGMESFLNKLSVPILRSHCTEMKLTSTGPKKTLVETLMVHIFELEPLEEEDDKKSTKKEKGKSEKPSKEKKEKTEKASKEKKEKPSKEKKVRGSPKKEVIKHEDEKNLLPHLLQQSRKENTIPILPSTTTSTYLI